MRNDDGCATVSSLSRSQSSGSFYIALLSHASSLFFGASLGNDAVIDGIPVIETRAIIAAMKERKRGEK